MKRLALVCFCMFLFIGCEPAEPPKPADTNVTVPCCPDRVCPAPAVEEVAGRYHLRRRTGRFFRRIG
jgi:hypothetical protein